MPLDDFFAKKDKKKSKKKQSTQSLIEKLTKETEKLKEQECDAPNDSAKLSSVVGDDEWDTLDDEEKDVDLQTIRIGKLAVGKSEEANKQGAKDSGDKDGGGENEGDKKVWSFKQPEVQEVEEPESKPEPKPVSQKYIPISLRPGGARAPLAVKPNVSSDTDFPTLDVAVTNEHPPKKAEEKPKADEEGDSWEQAGAPRRSRASEVLPIAIKSSYVPPGLRAGGGAGLSFSGGSSSLRHGDFRDSRPRDDGPHRYSAVGSGFKREGFAQRETLGSETIDVNASDWTRGKVIQLDGGGSSFSTGISSPPRSANRSFHSSGSTTWSQGANIKTFREGNRDKPEFEIVQSNRFAGLSET
ncbi:unnamed protein product [Calicophoron daubneyi]|uniref:Uncharacterized protein n=1 Tax=Calicophoron daubneyi TaxID=300641 RepID=A0AAV2TQM3_CALDB